MHNRPSEIFVSVLYFENDERYQLDATIMIYCHK